MESMPVVITIIASLLSGAVATLVTLFVNKKDEKKKIKLNLVNEIIGYRFQLNKSFPEERNDIYYALCRIPIVFNDNATVMYAFNEFAKNVKISGSENEIKKSEECKENLIWELCEAVDLKYERWDTDNFKSIIK